MSDVGPRTAGPSWALAADVLLAAARTGVYAVIGAYVLTLHQVPPHPWKAGLAYLATAGLITLLEALWIRTSTPHDGRRAHAAVVCATVLASALVLSWLGAVGILASGQN